MSSTDAVELGRQAIWTGLIVGSPVLLIGMAVGLIIGLLQALTQVQEQTIAFVPKIFAMVLVLLLLMPWLLTRMMEYAGDLITDIPQRL